MLTLICRCTQLVILLSIFGLSNSVFSNDILPPLVPNGENLKDFPDWKINNGVSYNDIAYSPDGNTIASTSNDKTIRLWDINSKTLIHAFESHTSPAYYIAFSPDGIAILNETYHY